MVRMEDTTATTGDARAFLQRRVGLFGAVSGGCFLFILPYRLLDPKARAELTEPSLVLHGASVGMFLGVWALCRVGTHSLRVLRGIDALGVLLGAAPTVLMGLYIIHPGRPDQVLLLALTAALTARAIWVPSSARRTFLITLGVGVELLVGVYVIYLSFEPELWRELMPEVTKKSPQTVAAAVTIGAAVWWSITLAISTGASTWWNAGTAQAPRLRHGQRGEGHRRHRDHPTRRVFRNAAVSMPGHSECAGGPGRPQ